MLSEAENSWRNIDWNFLRPSFELYTFYTSVSGFLHDSEKTTLECDIHDFRVALVTLNQNQFSFLVQSTVNSLVFCLASIVSVARAKIFGMVW